MEENHSLLLTKASFYRGQVIEQCIHLENAIEQYIISTITDDDVVKLKLTIYLIEKMTFDAKIGVLEAIWKNTGIANKKLIGKIRSAKDNRNYFAHQLTSYSQKDIDVAEEQITFTNFRNNIIRKSFNQTDIDKIIVGIVNLTSEIFKMKDEIPPLTPPSD